MMVDIINIDALWNVASVVLVAAAIGGEGGFDTVHDVPSFVNAFVGNAFDNEMSTMATMNRKSRAPPPALRTWRPIPNNKEERKTPPLPATPKAALQYLLHILLRPTLAQAEFNTCAAANPSVPLLLQSRSPCYSCSASCACGWPSASCAGRSSG
jgi:hypothetical protein